MTEDPTDFEIWFIEHSDEVNDRFCKVHKKTLREFAKHIWQEVQMED